MVAPLDVWRGESDGEVDLLTNRGVVLAWGVKGELEASDWIGKTSGGGLAIIGFAFRRVFGDCWCANVLRSVDGTHERLLWAIGGHGSMVVGECLTGE